MPGDGLDDHPLYTGKNPYLTLSFSELMLLLEHGGLTIPEERQVREALQAQRSSHASPTRFLGPPVSFSILRPG